MIHRTNSTIAVGLLAISLLAAVPLPCWAGPGAHGPNGEHLDAAQTARAEARQASPRFEARSDLFEMVGTLSGGELSILMDRFDTNEPVLKAQVEIESGGLKVVAKFHEDLGDYSVDDPEMLKKLTTPGEHPLVITVLAGKDSDLLDAVLRVQAVVVDDHAHGIHWAWWVLGGLGSLGALALVGIATTRLRRRRAQLKGGLA
jgi:hypothetical protein